MKSDSDIIVKNGPDDLALAAAQIFTDSAIRCTLDYGRFTAVLSGGSTPRLFHNLISKAPFVSEIPWKKMHLFWSDERCVSYDHPYSNFGAARKDLIDHVPIPESHIHPMNVGPLPERGATDYEEELVGFFDLKKGEIPRFDIIFLGMGTNGHTASLFPGRPELEEMAKLVVSAKGGDPDVFRLTMTLPVINNAAKIVIMVSGKQKAEILRVIFEDSKSIGPLLPVQRVRPANGELIWLVDQDAASLVK
jgi:6-phosphogluconolactonase